MAREKEYTRLPGAGLRGAGFSTAVAVRSRLWLGKDHLLCVDSMRFAEDYKRFYFRDIQALIIRKTERGKIWNIVFGALALPPLIAALATTAEWRIVWGIMAGIFLTFVLVNTLYGPTCKCHLRTAVQTEELPSLRRLRVARKVLARLRPHIAAAQGELAPEEIPARMAELAKPPVAFSNPVSTTPTDLVFQPPVDPNRLEHQ